MPNTHTFRNRKGELVSMPELSASQAKTAFGEVLERVATTGGVAITRHNVPKAVVISWEEFESLSRARNESLKSLTGRFDGLVASMQTPRARAAMAKLFAASPEELGRAAVEAARPRRAAAARRTRR
ncbi:MAG TPA: type II toxin-antitoxin system Phd/YefM family antitoxin [Thermoanaerobaculia bacterium]|jgi:prevent-host-death family protein|nr:type II toxin-antitoxin system Phd/YefM family antitoxin [Thermoanaerobaculia bacterium]